MKLFFAALVAFALSANAAAETPAFDPRDWRGTQGGPPTQMLTIGNAHLVELPTPVTAEMLAPVLDRLAAWKPDIITHEAISGEQCDTLARYGTRYPGMLARYCWGTEEAAKATGLDVAAALVAIEKELADLPAHPSAAQRRRLAALFLAANDRFSAQVQWLQLPAAERIAADGLDAPLLSILARTGRRPHESYDIAVALAVRLGHQRVFAVDDHTADSVQALAQPGLDAAMLTLWDRPRQGPVAEFEDRAKRLGDASAVLDFYRFLNRPETQRSFVTEDFGHAIKDPKPPHFGRTYVAWTEIRNLRMVANIRAAAATQPGARVLNIVGAAHKPYYDAYLAMMSDVVLVDAEAVLK
ncbi:MAG: DUF5694 domain-containing protein [Sphingomonadaceae bacterium]